MVDVPESVVALLRPLIAQSSWRATTYIAPHSYTLTDDKTYPLWDAMFTALVDYGEWRPFYTKRYRYVVVDGYRYWMMGNLINRAQEE